MSCGTLRHHVGPWTDVKVQTFVIRRPDRNGRGCVVEFAEQSRTLFDGTHKNAFACCVETRTIARITGELRTGNSVRRLRDVMRSLEGHLQESQRERQKA